MGLDHLSYDLVISNQSNLIVQINENEKKKRSTRHCQPRTRLRLFQSSWNLYKVRRMNFIFFTSNVKALKVVSINNDKDNEKMLVKFVPG